MKVYTIQPGKDLNSCTEKDIKNIIPWLEESEIGDIITIEVVEMSEEEYNFLPEYMGP